MKSKQNTDMSEKGEEVSQYISIAGKQYILYKGRVIISEQEASEIHQQYFKQRVNNDQEDKSLNNLMKFDDNSLSLSKKSSAGEMEEKQEENYSSAQWKNDETFLL